MRRNGEGKPVVALDIDGTLGDYHKNFFKFADLYFGDDFRFPSLVKTNHGLPLWEHMGLTERDYRDAKLAYRQGGWKRWMPVYPGAPALTALIRGVGAEVWLCTTRPYLRLDNVDPDTREWLRRNKIEYDALLFDPVSDDSGTKYDELKRQAGDRVCSIVDDLPEMYAAARDAFPDIPPVLRDQPYNRHITVSRRAYDSDEIWYAVSQDINEWRSTRG